MKISIIGAGGVGGYFGARLAAAGNDINFVVRGQHKSAMDTNGLLVKSIKGDVHIKNVRTFEKISQLPLSDLVLVAVKSWQVREVAAELGAVLSENTMVLPLQNGVLASDELKELIPEHHVLGGLCRIFSRIESPGVIKHVGVEPTIIFGELDNRKTDRVHQIHETFTSAGIKNFVPEKIEVERWKKFISICLSGLMAISRTTYGEMRIIPEMRKMMFELMHEVKSVADAMGIQVGEDYIDKVGDVIDTYPFDATASLTRDVWDGRPSEIEYQNGTVLSLAKKYKVDVPLNRFVFHALLPSERKARKSDR